MQLPLAFDRVSEVQHIIQMDNPLLLRDKPGRFVETLSWAEMGCGRRVDVGHANHVFIYVYGKELETYKDNADMQ